MDLVQVREWVLVLSACATLLSIAISIWVAVNQYRLKLKAEERLARSSQAETDLRLLTAFSELVVTASSTGRYLYLDKVIEAVAEAGLVTQEDLSDPVRFRQKVMDLAMFPEFRGGKPAIRMAAFAIAALATRYEFLRPLGIKALEMNSIQDNDPEALKILLDQLKSNP